MAKTLSDKIDDCGEPFIWKQDVKQFITDLKKELHETNKIKTLFHCNQCKSLVVHIINKLAGKELVE